MLKPEGFRQRVISLISKTAIPPWSEFLASLLGHVRHIEANGDLLLDNPQTQNRCFRFEKRTQYLIRTHNETLSVAPNARQQSRTVRPLAI
jgi:hypothetical protein